MEKLHIQQTDSNLINHAGLAFIVKFLNDESVFTGINRFYGIKRGPGMISDYDIIKTMLALICLGKTDFDDIEQFDLSSYSKIIMKFCDQVFDYITNNRFIVNLARLKKDSQEGSSAISIPKFKDEPKILQPYLESALSQVINIIRNDISQEEFDSICQPQNDDRDKILKEFVFMINVARGLKTERTSQEENNLIPDNLGYLLLFEQIKAIRDNLKSNKNNLLNELSSIDIETKSKLLNRFNELDADKWIDEIQNLVYISNRDNEKNKGLSSYVNAIKQIEYSQNIKDDPRVNEQTDYPKYIKFIEDRFIHGKCVLMIPLFFNGNIAALFWMNSNKPLNKDICFSVISSVRKYEYQILNAFILECFLINPFVNFVETKNRYEWINALEDMIIHPLTRIKNRFNRLIPTDLNNKYHYDEIDFIIEIIRSLKETDQKPDLTYNINLFECFENMINHLNIRNHCLVGNEIDKKLSITTNKPLLLEIIKITLENSYKEVVNYKEKETAFNIETESIKIKSFINEDSFIEIHIWDCGDKFPSEIIENLFKQAVNSQKLGMGKGLYLAQLIISRLDGKILLEQDNKTLKIILPKRSSKYGKF